MGQIDRSHYAGPSPWDLNALHAQPVAGGRSARSSLRRIAQCLPSVSHWHEEAVIHRDLLCQIVFAGCAKGQQLD